MKRLSLPLIAALASPCWGEIRYDVDLVRLDRLEISIKVPIREPVTRFQIPNFAPGHYVLLSVANDVSDVSADGPDGKPAAVEKTDANTYSINTPNKGTVTFRYAMPLRPAEAGVLWQGPYVYMYVVGRKEEPCRLVLKGFEGAKFGVPLDPAKGRNEYTAPNYDVLADSPICAGDLLTDIYTVDGKPHHMNLYGAAKTEVDLPYLNMICKRLTEAQGRMFGGLPYKRYMWQFRVVDSEGGGGGLEHLNSTNITLATGLSSGTISLLSHEFFHLWNVKRIRSKPLGPFDYLSIPKTGALWWLEGTTDYFASLVCARTGLWSEEEFFADLMQNVSTTRANPRRMEISPYEASFRVGEAAGGRGNSQGFGINYYNTGWVAGLCLDAEIRHRTGGLRSLDDVVRNLYNLCRDNRPGFEEDEIRRQLIAVAGPDMGPIYDSWIMKPGELPVEAQLEKLGYRFGRRQVISANTGYRAQVAKAQRGMRVLSATGPAEGKLQRDDIIVAVNGVPCDFPTLRSILGAYRKGLGKPLAGTAIALKVRRGETVIDVEIVPNSTSREEFVVDQTVFGDASFTAKRRGWIREQ